MESTTNGADRASTGARSDGQARWPGPDLVSVIMPVRNARATLPHQLEAMAEQTWTGDWELVLVDDGSRDGSPAVATRFADRLPLRLVSTSARHGISAARNQGIAAARGQLLLFCDADDVVSSGWLAAMVETAHRGDVVGGRFEIDRLNRPDVRTSRPAPQGDTGLAKAHGHAYATGASLGIWASVAEALGGFEESFRTAGDDVDLSWRAQRAGYRLVHAPDAVTHYRYRTSTTRMVGQAFRYGLADTMLYRRYRHDLPRPALGRYARIVTNLPMLLRGPASRRRWWCWHVGLRLGMLLGVVHPRTWLVAPIGVGATRDVVALRAPRMDADPRSAGERA